MRLLKYAAALAVVAVVFIVIIANFSTVESRFACSGETLLRGERRRATVYFKHERYRWWVDLWSDSDGSAWLEVPNEWVEHYGDTVRVGEQLQLFDSSRKLRGQFSTLSRTLAVDIPGTGFFDGKCQPVE
jgi:hypothetical protein